ncbi:MAG: hypothetical protein IJT08_00090 [Alphaproteobacteria bacterium]|nr:hypothetical protein [Alphaproteobacteria bacterium]
MWHSAPYYPSFNSAQTFCASAAFVGGIHSRFVVLQIHGDVGYLRGGFGLGVFLKV